MKKMLNKTGSTLILLIVLTSFSTSSTANPDMRKWTLFFQGKEIPVMAWFKKPDSGSPIYYLYNFILHPDATGYATYQSELAGSTTDFEQLIQFVISGEIPQTDLFYAPQANPNPFAGLFTKGENKSSTFPLEDSIYLYNPDEGQVWTNPQVPLLLPGTYLRIPGYKKADNSWDMDDLNQWNIVSFGVNPADGKKYMRVVLSITLKNGEPVLVDFRDSLIRLKDNNWSGDKDSGSDGGGGEFDTGSNIVPLPEPVHFLESHHSDLSLLQSLKTPRDIKSMIPEKSPTFEYILFLFPLSKLHSYPLAD